MKNLDLLIPTGQPESDSWRWATVTVANPLTIRLDGDIDPLDLVPDNTAGTLMVGDRVWTQISGKRVIVVTRASGPARTTPVGAVEMFAGVSSKIPTGWLLCDGSSLLRASYPELFATLTFTRTGSGAASQAVITTSDTSNLAVGTRVEGPGVPAGATVSAINPNVSFTLSANLTTAASGSTFTFLPFGAVDSTHFNAPNLKGKIPVGRDASQTEFDVLGETGGEKTHLLSNAEMPRHSHGGGTGYVSNDHSHNPSGTNNFLRYTGAGGGNVAVSFGGNNAASGQALSMSGITANHYHGINPDGGNADGTTNAHNNLQPYVVLNYIICAL